MDDLYKRVFDVIPGYVSIQDRDLRVIATNRWFREDFGDHRGSLCYEAYKGRTEKCSVCPVELTFKDGQIHSSEELVTTNSGLSKRVIVYTAPVRNSEGGIDVVVELSTDITKVKLLQEKFRMLFEEVPCYISVQDRDLRVVEANRRFRADFGDAIGEPCYRAYMHRTEPCLRCPVSMTFEDGEVHTSEEVVTSRYGKHVNVLCSAAPLRNTVGEIDSVMEMSTNITDLREVQSQLTSLGMLVGSVAHGIKGLLSGLNGGFYLMDTGLENDAPERVARGREMVRRNADRIQNMVLNLLYYSKDREIHWQTIDLEELTDSVARTLDWRADLAKVRVDVKCQPGTMEADYNAIHATLINLVENAIDACRVDKSETEHVTTFAASADANSVVFTISDNGIGMDQETREKAFSLFFSSKGTEGTGLGLFVAHKTILAHGGTIDIASTPREGTRFRVVIPRRNAANRP